MLKPLAAALFVAALGIATVAASPAQARVRITFFVWAGSNQGVVPRDVIHAYTAAHPDVTVDILESNNQVTYPRMVAAKRATPNSPLVDCGFFNMDTVTQGDAIGMWESLNPANIPNMAHVFPQYRRPDNRGVPYQMSTIGLLYNKDVLKTLPDSWTDLWSPKFKGRVVMFDYDTQMLVMAARLNGGSAHAIAPGFKVWAQHADNFRALVNSNDGIKNALASGDAWIAPWYNSISAVWMKEGSPFGFAIPKEGAIAFPYYLMIVQGVDAPQRRVCEDLINTLLEAKNATRYAELTDNIPLVEGAQMTAEEKANPALNFDTAKSAIMLDYDFIGKETVDWHQRWDRQVKFRMH